jgi:hypothetical protein
MATSKAIQKSHLATNWSLRELALREIQQCGERVIGLT